MNPAYQQFVVAPRQVSPADASCKEYIATEENLVICRVEAETSRTVSGNKKGAEKGFRKARFWVSPQSENQVQQVPFPGKARIL